MMWDCTLGDTLKSYGVATISRLLKMIGLFCKRALQKRLRFSKETYNFKEPTNRSHPILTVPCFTTQGVCSNIHFVAVCCCLFVAVCCSVRVVVCCRALLLKPSAHTLQHTATHCNTLQHTATHCNSLQQSATVSIIMYQVSSAVRRCSPLIIPAVHGGGRA